MFQSIIVKNTFASIASVVVVVVSPPPPPSRRLRALSRPRRRCRPCCHVYVLSCLRVVMLSVRTHSGCSVSMLIDRKIACNQGKGSFVILIMSVRS